MLVILIRSNKRPNLPHTTTLFLTLTLFLEDNFFVAIGFYFVWTLWVFPSLYDFAEDVEGEVIDEQGLIFGDCGGGVEGFWGGGLHLLKLWGYWVVKMVGRMERMNLRDLGYFGPRGSKLIKVRQKNGKTWAFLWVLSKNHTLKLAY